MTRHSRVILSQNTTSILPSLFLALPCPMAVKTPKDQKRRNWMRFKATECRNSGAISNDGNAEARQFHHFWRVRITLVTLGDMPSRSLHRSSSPLKIVASLWILCGLLRKSGMHYPSCGVIDGFFLLIWMDTAIVFAVGEDT